MKYFCFNKGFWHYARPSVLVFILTAPYLIYLSLIAQAIIVNDSIGYEQLGKLLDQHGLMGYLKDGVQREPMYPFLISISMRLADESGLPFEQIQKWIQIVLLMMTQAGVFVLLKKMDVRRWLTAMVVFAIGATPALVNSALWTYSEVMTYPFIVLLILLCGVAWQLLKKNGHLDAGSGGLAAGLGLCCVVLTMTKAVFELVVPAILGVFILGALSVYARKERKFSCALLLFVAISGIFYYGPVTGYKWLNWKQNGSFVLTNRGPWALYGYTLRRMEPMDARRFTAMLAYIPGPEFCGKVLDNGQCLWWSIYPADKLAYDHLNVMLGQNLKQEDIDRRMLALSFNKIMEDPIRFFSLMCFESFKALFWANDYDFQVAYPDWVDAIYRHKGVFMAIAFVLALMTILAYGHLAWRSMMALKKFPTNSLSSREIYMLFIFVLISVYIACYALIYVTPRYALPVVPLYLVMIAYWLESLLSGAKSNVI